MSAGFGYAGGCESAPHSPTSFSLSHELIACRAGHGEDREEDSEAAAGGQAQGEKARPARHWCVHVSSRAAAGEARRSSSCLFAHFHVSFPSRTAFILVPRCLLFRLVRADRAGVLRQGEGKRNRGSKPWKANAKVADQDDRCESHRVLRVLACVRACVHACVHVWCVGECVGARMRERAHSGDLGLALTLDASVEADAEPADTQPDAVPAPGTL